MLYYIYVLQAMAITPMTGDPRAHMLNKLKDRLLGRSQMSSDENPADAMASERQVGDIHISEQMSPFDVGLWDDMTSGWYKNQEDEIYEGFHIAPEDVVLDVGCGDGGRSKFCAARGCHIIYSDIDPGKVSLTGELIKGSAARKKEGVVSDTDPLPLEAESVTRVIATEIIEHVDSPGKFLAELVRVGKPGGLYLLTVPDALSERTQVGLAAPQYFQKPNHIHIIEREQFRALVTDSGLEIVSHSFHGFFWTLWWMFFWSSGQPKIGPPWTDVLDHWTRTWAALKETPHGLKVKNSLDDLMPKCQVIVARKP
jgi:ubiquinone/menaquinone biosynthesis C-methylase UbiE